MRLILLLLLAAAVYSEVNASMKVNTLEINSVHIDSSTGFSFKNMIIRFKKDKGARKILENSFESPKYILEKCKDAEDETECMQIRNSEYKSRKKEGKK